MTLSRREALGGGASMLALWGATQVSAAQSEPVYPSDVCPVVSNQHPDDEPEVSVEGCKVYFEVERDPARVWYTVKDLGEWRELTVKGESPWTDTDGDGLLELPNDDGVDIENGKVRNAPSAPDDVVRQQDVVLEGGHDLGGPEHNADSLSDLNDKVSDATLDDQGDVRPPESHDHQGEVLRPAEVWVELANDEFLSAERSGAGRAIYSSVAGSNVRLVGPRGPERVMSGPVASDTTVRRRAETVLVDTSGGSITITVGTELERDGLTVVVKDSGGNAGLQPIMVEAESGSSIDGSSGDSINDNYGARGYVYSGSVGQWFTLFASTGL
jgi:hypothetical protein